MTRDLLAIRLRTTVELTTFFSFTWLHASIEHSLIFTLLKKAEPTIQHFLGNQEEKEIKFLWTDFLYFLLLCVIFARRFKIILGNTTTMIFLLKATRYFKFYITLIIVIFSSEVDLKRTSFSPPFFCEFSLVVGFTCSLPSRNIKYIAKYI